MTKVRIRIGNLTMTNHPIHVHGHEFTVTGTDGGPTPKSTRWPEVTTDIAVGQMRQIEFVADEEGDWAFHCHTTHERDGPRCAEPDRSRPPWSSKKISSLIPDYMVMGERGMADMTEMDMPIPDNTVPMMTGGGPLARSKWAGGMFSVLKVRRDQKPGDYKDPGWFKHPVTHGRPRVPRALDRTCPVQGRRRTVHAPNPGSPASPPRSGCASPLRTMVTGQTTPRWMETNEKHNNTTPKIIALLMFAVTGLAYAVVPIPVDTATTPMKP